MLSQDFYVSFLILAVSCVTEIKSQFLTGGISPMAIVWQSDTARQHYSVRGSIKESQAEHSRGIFTRVGYVFLHQLDLILTLYAVSAGLSELNPIMRSMLAAPVLLVAVKLVIPVLIAWLVPSKLLLPAFALLSLVVIWNIKELIVLLF